MVHPTRLEGGSFFDPLLVLRRQVRAELAGIHDELQRSLLQDEMTQKIRGVIGEFFSSLQQSEDTQTIVNRFISRFQGLLVDQIRNAPLREEEALLGNDGVTYGRSSLCIYLSTIPEHERHRSPIHPENGIPFITEPHPHANRMLSWLRGKNALLDSQEIEEEYRELARNNRLPEVPTQRTERLRQIRDTYARLKRERDAPLNQLQQQQVYLQRQLRGDIVRTFAPIHDQVHEVGQSQMQILEDLAKDDRNQHQGLNQEIAQLQDQANDLDALNVEQNQQLQRLNGQILEAQRDNTQLQQSISKIKKAIKKKNRGWVKGLATTAGTVAGCAMATWAVAEIFPLANATPVFTPQSNGIKGTITFPF